MLLSRAVWAVVVSCVLCLCLAVEKTCGNETFDGRGFTNLSVILQDNLTNFSLIPERAAGGFTFYSWLFPNTLVFSCSGLLGGWIFKSEVTTNLSAVDNLPLLQVFYNDTRESSPDEQFRPRVGTGAVPRVKTISKDGVYEYTLPSPVNVQEGDVVAIIYQQHPTIGKNFLPVAFRATSDNNEASYYHTFIRFTTLFEYPKNDSGPPESGLVRDFSLIPMITAVMYNPTSSTPVPQPSSSSSGFQVMTTQSSGTMTLSTVSRTSPTSSSSFSSSPSPSPLSTPFTSSTSEFPSLESTRPPSQIVVVAGGVLGGLVVGVFVMIVVIAGALLVCRRKRRKKADIVAASEFAEPLENPTYLSGPEVEGDPGNRKSEGVYDKPQVESNLDAAVRRNGHVTSAFSGENGVHAIIGNTGHVQNYEVPEVSQSGELSGSVVYHEVNLKTKEGGVAPGRKPDYYNVPPSSQATPQDYSLPSDCGRPQDYSVPEAITRSQDYATPMNPSLNSREYAAVRDVSKARGYSLPEGPQRPQDYSLPNVVQKNPTNFVLRDLTDPEDYSVPDPEDYASPVASERPILKSQLYEVPAIGAGGAGEDSSSLDMSTQREREISSRPHPDSDSSLCSTPSPAGTSMAGCSDPSRRAHGRGPGPFFVEEDIYWVPASSQPALYEQLATKKYREILRPDIRIIRYLGSGQFGTVNLGRWQRKPEEGGEGLEVAVKMLKPLSKEEDKVKFLQEAAIMGQFLHPHVVKLHGVVTMGEPVMIVLEFMEKGDLQKFLRKDAAQLCVKADESLPHLLLNFCREIASGMAYLSSKSFVHRDLAARNVLLSAQTTCKIGDFGMSRDLVDSDYYITHGGQIPVRWTAPEALNFRKYSTASDVWSYGTVMYEIWSLGRTPYDGYTNKETMDLLSDGFRLAAPPGISRALYELIIRCWHEDSSRRPLFSAIVTMLSHGDEQLLQWSEEDWRTSSVEARSLGAPKDSGNQLYKDLRNYYKTSRKSYV